MYGCMDVWMYGCMDGWMAGWLAGRLHERMDRYGGIQVVRWNEGNPGSSRNGKPDPRLLRDPPPPLLPSSG